MRWGVFYGYHGYQSLMYIKIGEFVIMSRVPMGTRSMCVRERRGLWVPRPWLSKVLIYQYVSICRNEVCACNGGMGGGGFYGYHGYKSYMYINIGVYAIIYIHTLKLCQRQSVPFLLFNSPYHAVGLRYSHVLGFLRDMY